MFEIPPSYQQTPLSVKRNMSKENIQELLPQTKKEEEKQKPKTT